MLPPFVLPFLITPFLLAPLISAHGKPTQIEGNLGGNGTSLGILGGVVPNTGPNSKTEIDTIVFNQGQDNCGATQAGGTNHATSGIKSSMALSGNTLPQISTINASISGTYHIVTSDGAGPLTVLIDPTGKGNFANAQEATVTTQVPGHHENIRKSQAQQKRWEKLLNRAGMVRKRAGNINKEFPFAAQLPDNMQCNGTISGQENVCMVKIVNPSYAGPFGGCVAVQQVGGDGVASGDAVSSGGGGDGTIGVASATSTGQVVDNRRRLARKLRV